MGFRKVYVDITLDVDKNGNVLPRKIRWEDGRIYRIDGLHQVCRAASAKVGGLGIRYTVQIGNHETYLFDENGRWFVEARDLS